MIRTLHGPGGITLVLDPSEIFHEDPGNGTPARVTVGDAGGSYLCAVDQQEVMDGRGRTIPLSQAQCDWLEAQADVVDEFLERGR